MPSHDAYAGPPADSGRATPSYPEGVPVVPASPQTGSPAGWSPQTGSPPGWTPETGGAEGFSSAGGIGGPSQHGAGRVRRAAAPAPTGWVTNAKRAGGPLAAIAALLAKLGPVLLKLKALTVVGSLAISMAAYAWIWGWQFGVGFALLILVHEMGHVVVLRAQGVQASGPVFLPFIGAFVRVEGRQADIRAEAVSALSGPVVGSLGALACWYLGLALGSDLLIALAFTGFFLNLFNLLPMLPLDGGRVAGALHPGVWVAGLGVGVAYELWRPSPIVPLLLLVGGYELYHRWRGRKSPDARRYHAIASRDRFVLGGAYVGLALLLVVGLHATYVTRTF